MADALSCHAALLIDGRTRDHRLIAIGQPIRHHLVDRATFHHLRRKPAPSRRPIIQPRSCTRSREEITRRSTGELWCLVTPSVTYGRAAVSVAPLVWFEFPCGLGGQAPARSMKAMSATSAVCEQLVPFAWHSSLKSVQTCLRRLNVVTTFSFDT